MVCHYGVVENLKKYFFNVMICYSIGGPRLVSWSLATPEERKEKGSLHSPLKTVLNKILYE